MFHYLMHSHRPASAFITFVLLLSFFLSPLGNFAHAEEGGDVPETETTQENLILEENPEETEEVAEESQPEEQETTEESENDGEDGESGTETDGDPSLVVTGDAVAKLDQESAVNFNETGVGTSSPAQNSTTTASTTDDTYSVIPVDTTASTSNEAIVDTTATVTAQTGSNTAGGNGSTILTGDAVAYANIINLVNTNIFNSNGLVAFFNTVLGISALDLRNAFGMFENNGTAVSTPECSLSICDAENVSLNIANNNNATITNSVTVGATTGSNTANGSGGTIATGNAFAAANIFNIANTNITDSNYLLLSFNNFGDYAGDIVLPAGNILSTLFGASGANYGNATVQNNNNATITNTVSVDANTGGNEASGGLVVTGDAYAQSAVSNMVNTNLFGGSDLLIVLRIHGDWNGEIFGLPEGLAWAETDGGIVLYNEASGNPGTSKSGNLSLTNTNNATINNNVSVYALTGDNKVDGEEGVIATGDAYAASNITNVANTNILGQNWALLVFDIFGNWGGNLTFGQQDLWIGGKATPSQNPVVPGTDVTYTFTVTNRGDKTATNVVLDQLFSEQELIMHTIADTVDQSGLFKEASWNLGNLAPGETKEVSYRTSINNNLPNVPLPVTLQASVSSDGNDADDSDNTETITIYSGEIIRDNGRNAMRTFPAKVEIEKTANTDHVQPGESVDYTIHVTNHGGPLFHSILRDILTYEDGEMVSEQYWDLGTIQTDETVTVTYSTLFGEDAEIGTYTNTADIKGLERERTWSNGDTYLSAQTEHTLTIGGLSPEVLGASTDICLPYLKTFMRIGADNDETEVAKLQTFLNDHMDAGLSSNGFFDLQTEQAVRTFQSTYSTDILQPWGMTTPSGYVYLTTRKKINEIYCDYSQLFPLTESQTSEVEKYRYGITLPDTAPAPLPLFGEAGGNPEEDSSISIGTIEEAILNNESVSVIDTVRTQNSTNTVAKQPLFPPLMPIILRAINWFKDLAQI